MKIIHIESGLGNQMLSYAEYLVMCKNNPTDNCYIETMVYDIPECNDVICQWNGYELDRIFGIHAPNIKEKFDSLTWKRIMERVQESKFWENEWNYPSAIVDAINEEGYSVQNLRGVFHSAGNIRYLRKFLHTRPGYFFKRIMRPLYADKLIRKYSTYDKIFIKTSNDIFAGQFLGLSHKKSGIEFVEEEIKASFRFPALQDEQNIKLMQEVVSCNSIAIHVRRSDSLGYNGYLYRYGYFKRAVKYMKKSVKSPVFYFFSDSGSVEWCKHNLKEFGLDKQKDKVCFVDWNNGENSYRDMQMMSYCKHNIITFSSFGWWGCYLNNNPDKITISPNVWLDTTVTI